MEIKISIDRRSAGISDGLQELGDSLNDIISSDIQDSITDCKDKMQQQAAVDTGYMRDNIEITDLQDTSATIESKADYSGYVEYGHKTRLGTGTSGRPPKPGGIAYVEPQPFFEPAVIEITESLIQKLVSDIQSKIDDVSR